MPMYDLSAPIPRDPEAKPPLAGRHLPEAAANCSNPRRQAS
jgi:hypothetical protein